MLDSRNLSLFSLDQKLTNGVAKLSLTGSSKSHQKGSSHHPPTRVQRSLELDPETGDFVLPHGERYGNLEKLTDTYRDILTGMCKCKNSTIC